MKITISDFSGGLTDSPYTSDMNCGSVFENWLIQKDRTIEVVPGVEIFSSVAPRIPSNKRIQKMARLANGNFIAFSDQRAYYVTPSSISELKGPTGNKAFNTGSENSVVSITQSLNHIHATNDDRPYQIKIYIDGDGNPQLRTAGIPQVSTDPTITGTGSNNFIYAFVYYYEYRVGNTLFVDYGSPRFIQKTAMGASVSISNFPSLDNGVDYNWDTANIKIKIFRTVNNGQTLYYVGEVANGFSGTFTDTVTDAALVTNEPLYTNGGIRPNDMPAPSEFIFEANDTQYHLGVYQNGEVKPFRLLQAITNDPDSVPEDFFTDFRGTLKGGGAVGRSPIILTENQVIRLDGLLDEAGKGVIQKEILSNVVGGISHNGVVQGSGRIYFPGPDAFYVTNGFSEPAKIARVPGTARSKIDSIYKRFTNTDEQRSRIQGVYDALNNRVYWTVQESGSDNDKIYVYDETYDAFTTISFNSGIFPTSIIMDGEDIIIGDAKGYIFRMSADYYTFPLVDVTKAVTNWNESPIHYSWVSVHITGGDASVNKWFTKTNVQGNPETNVNMAIRSYTNGEGEYKELYPVRVVPSLVWGDPSFTWGDDAFIWNRTGTLNQTRRFPAGRLRARQRQVEFTNAYYTILSSTEDTASYVTVNAGPKLATLVTPTSYSFGSNNEGYDMVIGNESYEIASGTGDTLVLQDPNGTLVSGTYPWSIKGYGKGQRAHLLNFSVEFEPMSDAGTKWHGGSEK